MNGVFICINIREGVPNSALLAKNGNEVGILC